MYTDIPKLKNYLQVISTSSELLYADLPSHRKQKGKQYLNLIMDRLCMISTVIETEL